MSAGLVFQSGTLLSVVAFLLMARAHTPRQYRRAWLVQFVAQPFWLASTFLADQKAMFFVSVFFTAVAVDAVLRFHAEVRAEQERTLP